MNLNKYSEYGKKIKKSLSKLFNNNIFQFSLAFFLIVGTILSLMINMMFDECRCYYTSELIKKCNTFPNCIDPDVPIPLTIVILVSVIIYIIVITKMKKKKIKPTNIEKGSKNNLKLKLADRKKILFTFFGIIGSLIIILILFSNIFKEKIDVKGTNMLEYLTILEDYGRDIDFDGITSGANCYSGKQTTTVKSDKYGKVIIEFSYCKSNNSVYIHVYN